MGRRKMSLDPPGHMKNQVAAMQRAACSVHFDNHVAIRAAGATYIYDSVRWSHKNLLDSQSRRRALTEQVTAWGAHEHACLPKEARGFSIALIGCPESHEVMARQGARTPPSWLRKAGGARSQSLAPPGGVREGGLHASLLRKAGGIALSVAFIGRQGSHETVARHMFAQTPPCSAQQEALSGRGILSSVTAQLLELTCVASRGPRHWAKHACEGWCRELTETLPAPQGKRHTTTTVNCPPF